MAEAVSRSEGEVMRGVLMVFSVVRCAERCSVPVGCVSVPSGTRGRASRSVSDWLRVTIVSSAAAILAPTHLYIAPTKCVRISVCGVACAQGVEVVASPSLPPRLIISQSRCS